MNFGGHIRAARIKAKLSQEELAKKIGYADKSMISRIENGKVSIDSSTLFKIMKALNTTPAQFFGDVSWYKFNTMADPSDVEFLEMMGWINGIPESATAENDGKISDSDLKFALFGTTEIDDDVLEDVKNFARFTQQQKKKSDK